LNRVYLMNELENLQKFWPKGIRNRDLPHQFKGPLPSHYSLVFAFCMRSILLSRFFLRPTKGQPTAPTCQPLHPLAATSSRLVVINTKKHVAGSVVRTYDHLQTSPKYHYTNLSLVLVIAFALLIF
jgi:hypothetical protein